MEITVGLLKGIDPIDAWGNTFHHEVASAVSTRDTQHRLRLEGRIRQVIIESHLDAFDGFQIAGIEHIARHLESIYPLTCRKTIGIVAHRVALVVVADGITEVDGIGGVLFQGILQLHHNLLTRCLNLWHFQLRGRDDDLVCRIL